MIAKPVYRELATTFDAYLNCLKPMANESQRAFAPKHLERIAQLVNAHMPSGSGFDAGTSFDIKASKPNRLVFHTEYHHMDEGSYAGWTVHDVIVTPSLLFGYDLRITGKDRNGIKGYMHQVFSDALERMVDYERA